MSTIYEEEFECVVCGNKFTQTLQGSCSIEGQNLDFMPWGAAIVPWPLPKCPNCGLVGEQFSKDEENLLKKYIKNNKIDIKKPNYYLLAKQYEFLKKDKIKIANNYVKATWESYRLYHDCVVSLMKKTIDLIDEMEINKEFRFQLVKLDFLRRLGKFQEAMLMINKIKSCDFYNELSYEMPVDHFLRTVKKNHFLYDGLEEIYRGRLSYRKTIDEILKIQEKLIIKKDTDRHELPDYLRESLNDPY